MKVCALSSMLVIVVSAASLLGCKGTCVTGKEGQKTTVCMENYSKSVCQSMTDSTVHAEHCDALGYTRKLGENSYAKP